MTARLLSTAAIVGAFLATPALAADPTPMATYMAPPQQMYEPEPMVTGQLQLYGGVFNDDGGSGGVFGGRGSANVVLPHHMNLRTQIDIVGNGGWYDNDDSDSAVIGAAHFYRLDPSSHAYGVFVGGGTFFGTTAFLVGAEAQHFWGPVTVGGDVAYWVLAENYDLWTLAAYMSYYFNQNTKLTGRIDHQGYTDGDHLTFLSLNLAHRFPGSPFGIFGEVAHFRYDYNGGGDGWQLVLGLNVDIDSGGSRLSADRGNTLWTSGILGGSLY